MVLSKLILAASLLSLVTLGCSSSSDSDNAQPGPDAGQCTVPLEQISGSCPATYEAAKVHPQNPNSIMRCAGQCGNYKAYMDSSSVYSLQCWYSPQTGALVGVEIGSDVTEFCSYQSRTKSGGETDPSCRFSQLDLNENCQL